MFSEIIQNYKNRNRLTTQFPKETYFSITYSMMRILYNLLAEVGEIVLWPTQFFSKKMKLFVEGRKGVFQELNRKIFKEDRTLWFHCASLGEFEQGLPIMEALKKALPNHKLVLTFFSPSGYEVRKNTPVAAVVTYLPLDSNRNVGKFLEAVHPDLVFFVKYEFWPNYLHELERRQIPTYLISGLFRREQWFFKNKGGFMRKALHGFQHFFVQNESSKLLLNGVGFNNVTLSGDTRFDRVSHQIEGDNQLDFMDTFKGKELCIVCGSTWPEDEAVLISFINSEVASTVKFVIAPHKLDPIRIKQVQAAIKPTSVLYSEANAEKLKIASVLLVDTIGLLSKIYSYADMAYVGGAMGKTGLHNILEPATFGIPVIIGNNFEKFPEALKLVDLGGLFPIASEEECRRVFEKFLRDPRLRENAGFICKQFVEQNTGATQCVMNYLAEQGKLQEG